MKLTLAKVGWLALLGGARLGAQTWQTVDDYSNGTGQSYAGDIAFDGAGGIYAVGATFAPGPVGIVRKSHDGGTTWTTVDKFGSGFFAVCVDAHGRVFAAGGSGIRRSFYYGLTWATVDGSSCRGLGTDTNGTIYAVGSDSAGWLVRRSQDGGVTWQTAGSPGVATGTAQKVVCIGTEVYVTGSSSSSDGGWLVFRSSDQGKTWSLLDSPGASGGLGMSADARGNLYVVGALLEPTSHWVARKGEASGSIWQTIDDYLPPTAANASARAVAIDTKGNLYVAGATWVTGVRGDWVVRQFSPPTSNWKTIDDFIGADGSATTPLSLRCDPSGNLYCVGAVRNHWLVRKLSATQPPTLQAATVGRTLIITWPTAANGFTLQWSDKPGLAATWSAFPGTPQVMGDQYVVMCDTTNGNHFFRLSK